MLADQTEISWEVFILTKFFLSSWKVHSRVLCGETSARIWIYINYTSKIVTKFKKERGPKCGFGVDVQKRSHVALASTPQDRPDHLPGTERLTWVSAPWSPLFGSVLHNGLSGGVWTKISQTNTEPQSQGSHLGFQAILRVSRGPENQ